MSLGCQRDLFVVPDDVTYLNTAYLAPRLRSVRAAGIAGVERRDAPWEIGTEAFFEEVEEVRALFARLIDAEADDVAIVPSVSHGLATAANNLAVPARSRIVVASEQFPSNVYAWHTAGARAAARVEHLAPDALLNAIDKTSSVVAVPQVHFTGGIEIDIAAVAGRCRETKTALVLDLTQSAGARPFSVRETEADFVAVAAYKWLLGPYGLAFLWVHPRHHGGRPIEQGWANRADSDDFARLVEYRDEYRHGARRFDGGQKNSFMTMPMAKAALEQLLAWGVPAIHVALSAWTQKLAEAAESENIAVRPCGHMAALTFPGGVPANLPQKLRERRVFVSVRGNSIRVAPHLHNDENDIDRLLAALD